MDSMDLHGNPLHMDPNGPPMGPWDHGPRWPGRAGGRARRAGGDGGPGQDTFWLGTQITSVPVCANIGKSSSVDSPVDYMSPQ